MKGENKMKKNNVLRILGVAAICGSLTLFAACSGNSNRQEADLTVNQAQVTNNAVSQAAEALTVEKAIDIALEKAGVNKADARFKTTKLDNDDGVAHYDIEFVAGNYEYDFEIGEDGSVLSYDKEAEKPSAAVTEAVKPKNEPATEAPKAPENNAGYISIDEAKNAALSHAGFAAADVVFEKASFDGDDLIPHYDVEFHADGYEYGYEINAKSGAVIEFDKEREYDKKVQTSDNASAFITADKAKAAAYAHAGVNAADVKYAKAELDSDDSVPHYEIEFVAGNYEYEYEINAKTSSVIASEKDWNDR